MSKSKKAQTPSIGEELGLDVFMDIHGQLQETEDDVELFVTDERVVHETKPDDLQSDCDIFLDEQVQEDNDDKQSDDSSDTSGEEEDTFGAEFNEYIDDEYLRHAIHAFSDDYQVIRTLLHRSGRYVYKVRERESEKMKVLTVSSDKYKDLRKNVEDTPREIAIMLHMKGIQGFAQIEAWGPLEYGCYFFVTPYYAGIDILLCQKDRTLFAKVVRSILEGLGELKAQGVAHRDISPENIIVNPMNPPNELVTIIDFDLSAWTRPGGFHHVVGRHDYYPPEKVDAMKDLKDFFNKRENPRSKVRVDPRRLTSYDDRADIFSCGCIMMGIITGKMPDNGMSVVSDDNDIKKVKREHPDVRAFVKSYKNRMNLSPEIDLCLKMLEFDVNKRISLADAVEHPFIDLSDEEHYTSEYKTFELKIDELQQEYAKELEEEGDDDEEEEEEEEDDEDDTEETDYGSDSEEDEEEEKTETSATGCPYYPPMNMPVIAINIPPLSASASLSKKTGPTIELELEPEEDDEKNT